MTARVVSCNIEERTGKTSGKPYEAVVAVLEFRSGKTREESPPLFKNNGKVSITSPGGKFLKGFEDALKAHGVEINGSFDTSLAEGKVFVFERVARPAKAGQPASDFTDLLPIECVGDDFPAQG